VYVTLPGLKLGWDTTGDGKADIYQVNPITTHDYYAFGMEISSRSYNSTATRYGFDTQEKTEEIASGHYTAQHWEYDSRLGRRWNIDPIMKSWESPYATFYNNPIRYTDFLGLTGGDDKYAVGTYKNGKESYTYAAKDKVLEKTLTDFGWSKVEGGNSSSSTSSNILKSQVPNVAKMVNDATLRTDYYKPLVEEFGNLHQNGKISDGTYSMLRYQAQKATKMQQSTLGKAIGEVAPFGKPLEAQRQLAESIASGEKQLSPNAYNTRGSTTALSTTTKVVGKSLVVVGAAMSVHHVVTADNQAQAISQEAGGWAGAWAGGTVGAQGGAYVGAGIGVWFAGAGAAPGAAIGAFIGGLGGSTVGYFAGYEAGGNAYNAATGK
jgi:RHS repeat-associated protein